MGGLVLKVPLHHAPTARLFNIVTYNSNYFLCVLNLCSQVVR